MAKARPAGVAVYYRVSTIDQRVDGQRADVERWLERHGYDRKRVQVYEDHESGATLSRPGFAELERAVLGGEVGTVVIWKLDRLSRSLRDGINVLADWCGRGVRVVSVTQQLDLTGTIGQIVAAVMLGLGQIEREHLLERQAAGIREAKKRGVYRGRRRGATKAKPQRARELAGKGLSRTEIATAMGVSARTVQRYLVQVGAGD